MSYKKNAIDGSCILITGGSGSWGNELVRQLLKKYKPKEVRIYSRGEQKQVEMKRKFQDPRLKYLIGDVREKERLSLACQGVDIVFHLAALKHVPICEENPWEAVRTNIIGTQNVIESSIQNGVKKVVHVSSDKAVDPLNVYGVTKACGEKLVIAANLLSKGTRFVCVRGGNVLGTNGSVVPLFKEQISKMNAITLTDERMTRFFMPVEEAIDMVLHAALNSYGGETFVRKIPACKITDLADVMLKRLANKKAKIKMIGIRPGEKINEVLVSENEMARAVNQGFYYVILPQIDIPGLQKHYNISSRKKTDEEFNSNNTKILNPEEIERMLEKDGWFDDTVSKEAMVYLKTLGKKELADFFK